jgi:hypothetical protein
VGGNLDAAQYSWFGPVHQLLAESGPRPVAF